MSFTSALFQALSIFSEEFLAKKCPLLLHLFRHFSSFHKKCLVKKVPENQDPSIPHILHPWLDSIAVPLFTNSASEAETRALSTPGCWPKIISLFFVGSSKKFISEGGVLTRPPLVPFIFVPQENFTAKLDWLGLTRLSPQIYPNLILSPYSELIVK